MFLYYREDMSTNERKKKKKLQKKLHHELFALRMDLLYKLSISNHYRDKIFWIPNNLDFRGRAYPIAPHCSHIGILLLFFVAALALILNVQAKMHLCYCLYLFVIGKK